MEMYGRRPVGGSLAASPPKSTLPEAALAGHAAARVGARRSSRFGRIAAVTGTATAIATDAAAQSATPALIPSGHHVAITLAVNLGLIVFAVIAAIAFVRARNRANDAEARLGREIADLRRTADRAEAILDSEDHVLLIWSEPGKAPEVVGTPPANSALPEDRTRLAAFGTWLAPQSAQVLDHAVTALREQGSVFVHDLEVRGGGTIEASGRTIAGRAAVKLRDLRGDRLANAEAMLRQQSLRRDVETIRALLETLPMPIWLRGDDGRLIWVNRAYASAVELGDAAAVAEHGTELLDGNSREALRAAHRKELTAHVRQPVVVAGKRTIYDIVDVVTERGSAGIATDVSEVEDARAELKRTIDFHARTLDQLATAVAIFGPDQRLQFYNAAYRALFGLDPAFLDGGPEDGAVLDKLRAQRKLPEQADYRNWRRSLTDAYRAVEAQEHWWHLPDGQTLRVVANPHPQGGVIWIYENVTERLDLESRYNALNRVQRESLDHLAEGVVVFGSDGRMRLHNPAFAAIWKLAGDDLAGTPHINRIVEHCSRIHGDEDVWNALKGAVTGLADSREALAGRMERIDGSVIDYTAIPLPDGATMLTFLDVSDSVAVERALKERAEALEAADHVKNAFVHHVSYELRSPLTNIIGFAQLLADAKIGALNDKQREYTGYITSSSKALLAIVNDILDLATIDAGIMELDLGPVDIAETIAGAVEGLQDRLVEAEIELSTDVPKEIGGFTGDEKRIRQVLFNLLSNAIAFSEDGGKVEIACRRDGDEVVFSVTDHGCGIPTEFIDAIFQPFESRPTAHRRRGAGLGLAIVKNLVELHGGAVEITSSEGAGTVATCRFPKTPRHEAAAAE